MTDVDIDIGKYSLGWSDPEKNVFKPEKGLNEDIIRKMSEIKEEPEWMLEWRLKAFERLQRMTPPKWVKAKFDDIDFQDLYYYASPKNFKEKPKSLDQGQFLRRYALNLVYLPYLFPTSLVPLDQASRPAL